MGRGRNSAGSRPSPAKSAQSSPAKALEKGLLPGRHKCDCQARTHPLVLNCLVCGRIVCVQEGSGPCFFCGELVCTREEREILDRGSKKSAELRAKLMGSDKGVSLSSVGAGLKKAVNFRDKLLVADADTERRTQVQDLECDYSNIENNIFLTPEERSAIIKRRNELREIREQRRKAVYVTLDFARGTAVEEEQKMKDTDPAHDVIIRDILERSEERRRRDEGTERLECQWVPKGFVPKYYETDQTLPKAQPIDDFDFLALQNDELMMAEVDKKGYTISLPQPTASLLMAGVIRFVRWEEDFNLKGPIFISSAVLPPSKSLIEEWKKRVPKLEELDLTHPVGYLLGRIRLVDCHTLQQFHENFSSKELIAEENGKYVMEFAFPEPLLQPIPYIPRQGLYTLERELRDVLRNACL